MRPRRRVSTRLPRLRRAVTTSPAPAGRACSPTSAAGCGASPTTSRSSCPFEEVVEALGRTGAARPRAAGRAARRDRRHRRPRRRTSTAASAPPRARLRARWERIAAAQRRGEALPPVSLFKIGDLYFVRDGHHRVSVAKSLGRDDIDAYVVEVTTRLRLGERHCASPTCRSRTTSGCSASACRCRPSARERIAAHATRGTSACWPRRSRRGASARCRTAAATWTAREVAHALVRPRSTSRSSSCCAPAT